MEDICIGSVLLLVHMLIGEMPSITESGNRMAIFRGFAKIGEVESLIEIPRLRLLPAVPNSRGRRKHVSEKTYLQTQPFEADEIGLESRLSMGKGSRSFVGLYQIRFSDTGEHVTAVPRVVTSRAWEDMGVHGAILDQTDEMVRTSTMVRPSLFEGRENVMCRIMHEADMGLRGETFRNWAVGSGFTFDAETGSWNKAVGLQVPRYKRVLPQQPFRETGTYALTDERIIDLVFGNMPTFQEKALHVPPAYLDHCSLVFYQGHLPISLEIFDRVYRRNQPLMQRDLMKIESPFDSAGEFESYFKHRLGW